MSRTRNERKRQKEETFFYLVVAVWAVCIVACLFHWLTREAETQELHELAEQERIAFEHEDSAEIARQFHEDFKNKTGPFAQKQEGPELAKLPSIENATLTHYCICKECCGKDESHPAYGITASGRKAEPYVSVAVDPFIIPLGSTVYIDYGEGEIQEYRADDTGSAITGAKIDLCVSDHEEALNHGVKTVRVWWEE